MVEAHSKIISFASYIPENYVPIDDFAAPADMPSKLDLNRITGLEGHRRSKENEGTLELALQAATKCIERSKVDVADIDLVINCAVGSLCSELRSKLSPSLANLIAEKLDQANVVLIALIDRIRMLDNDIIRLKSKINTVIELQELEKKKDEKKEENAK